MADHSDLPPPNAVPSLNRLLLLGADEFPPLSATARAEFAVRTRNGGSQPVNEDHHLVTRLARSHETLFTSLPAELVPRFDEYAYAMVVADGMGTSGELASRLAIVALVELALRFGEWRLRVEDGIARDIIDKINMFYRQIDSALVHANRSAGTAPLHTTLTAAVSAGRDLFFAHVGHSRAYLLRDDDLIQLTRDHTHMVRKDAARAPLVDLTGAASDRHHILTDALGAGVVDPQIDIERLTLANRDTVMLCTNGLTDAIGDKTIAEVLGSKQPVDAQAATLISLAEQAAAADDVTVVLARYHVPE